jgi:hypothetical protein
MCAWTGLWFLNCLIGCIYIYIPIHPNFYDHYICLLLKTHLLQNYNLAFIL